MSLLPVIFVGLFIGLLLGMTGIGGLLLAPMLAYLTGVDLHSAIATSLWSFLFTGATGTIAYVRMNAVSWPMVAWVSLGVIPATLLGARLNMALPTELLTVLLSVLIIGSALYALRSQQVSTDRAPSTNALRLTIIGLGVGFGSALIGAGGAVFLIPALLFFNVPALLAIGVSQVVQLPVAIFSSIGYLFFGEVNFWLGTGLGIVQAIGVFLGARIARMLPAAKLRQIVAIVLVLVGILMIWRIL